MGKVAVHQDGAIAFVPIRELKGLAEQRLDGSRIALSGAVGPNGQRQDFGVGRQDLRGMVARAVVADQDVILPAEGFEGLPNFPEHEPDGFGFISARNTDVNHSLPTF